MQMLTFVGFNVSVILGLSVVDYGPVRHAKIQSRVS
jgi:hypothetical protein